MQITPINCLFLAIGAVIGWFLSGWLSALYYQRIADEREREWQKKQRERTAVVDLNDPPSQNPIESGETPSVAPSKQPPDQQA